MWMNIEDSPFTEEEKEQIIAMGIARAEWGHPDTILDNPVAYFQNRLDSVKAKVTPDAPKSNHWDDEPVPFGAGDFYKE